MQSRPTQVGFQPRPLRSRRSHSLDRPVGVGLVLLIVCVGLLLAHAAWGTIPEHRGELYLIFSLITILGTSAIFLAILARWDGQFPLFEVGSVCVLVTTIYFSVPLINYLAAGMEFTIVSDSRLFSLQPTPYQISCLAWRSVFYLLSFSVVYLCIRGRCAVAKSDLSRPTNARVVILVCVFFSLKATLFSVERIYGVSFYPSYENLRAGIGLVTQLPYHMQQLMHNIQGIYFISQLALVMLVFVNWNREPVRVLGILWLLAEISWAALKQGARTEAVLLLMSAALLYHRFIRRLRFIHIATGAMVLLIAISGLGVIRDVQDGFAAIDSAGVSLFSVSNEFQALFGTTYDLYDRAGRGEEISIPWSLYASEFLMLIPSQLLPFEKVDPALWYLDLLGLRDTQVGFMFGVLSQAVLGLDWAELVLRGAALGLVLGTLHRWYVRHAKNYAVTLFYLCVCLWIYYTVRATTFYFVYFIVYRFLPFWMLIYLSETVLSGAVGIRRRRG